MRIQTGRVYDATSGDEARWRDLATYALLVGTGRARGIMKLRDLRHAAGSATILGADGEGNVCRRLMEVVNQHTDPRAVDLDGDELARLANEVLSRCDAWKAVRAAARGAS